MVDLSFWNSTFSLARKNHRQGSALREFVGREVFYKGKPTGKRLQGTSVLIKGIPAESKGPGPRSKAEKGIESRGPSPEARPKENLVQGPPIPTGTPPFGT